MKKTSSEMKWSLTRTKSTLDIEKEKIGKLEDMLIQTIQIK